jgi:hypothetical protein
MFVNIVVDDNKAKVYLDKLSPRIISEVKKELNHQAQEMKNLMQESFLTGGPVGGGSYSSRLRVRSGTLRKSLGIISATTDWANSKNANSITAGIHVGGGVPYARVHINKFGTVTTISGHPWLTVPALGGEAYKGALGQGGVKYARSKDFPNLTFAMIGGRPALVRGRISRAAKTAGKIVPMRPIKVVYWLLRSVRVPARVHPEWIVNLRSKFIYYGIKEAVARATTP